MNNLSWFLYAVDVVGNIGFICGIMFVGLSFAIIWAFGSIVINSTEPMFESDKARVKKAQSLLVKLIKPTIIVVVLGTFVPSTKTMYLILGSEVGETAINSETGKRVQDAINKKLDEYLKETK